MYPSSNEHVKPPVIISLQDLLLGNSEPGENNAGAASENGNGLNVMYGNLLRNYDVVKEDYTVMRSRYDDLVSSHSAAVGKLEHSQVG